MKHINLGIIGSGRIGKLHATNIMKHLSQFKLQTIADPMLDKEWATALRIPNLSLDANDIFNDPTIDAVLICSPSSFHIEHIIAAAQNGKHIFCEKPIATDIKEIKRALAEVKKAGVKLQVGFNRRFDSNFAKIKQSLHEQHIGTPQLLRITSRDPQIPHPEYLKSSGGMFIDMTIHDFDMARFLMGCDIEEVYASGNALIHASVKDCDDIDTAIINLKFTNGCLGVIDNSRQAVYGYDQRVEVLGSEGAIHADNTKPTSTTLSNKHGIISEKPHYFFLDRYENSFIAELSAFYDCMIHDTAPAVSGDDGLQSVMLSIAAEKSRRENRPVKISEIAGSH